MRSNTLFPKRRNCALIGIVIHFVRPVQLHAKSCSAASSALSKSGRSTSLIDWIIALSTPTSRAMRSCAYHSYCDFQYAPVTRIEISMYRWSTDRLKRNFSPTYRSDRQIPGLTSIYRTAHRYDRPRPRSALRQSRQRRAFAQSSSRHKFSWSDVPITLSLNGFLPRAAASIRQFPHPHPLGRNAQRVR